MVEFPRTIIGIAFIARTCKAFVQKCRQNQNSQSSKRTQLDASEFNDEHIFEEYQIKEQKRNAMSRYNSFRSSSTCDHDRIHDDHSHPTSPSINYRRRRSIKRDDKHNHKSSSTSSSENNNNNNNNNHHKCFPAATNYFSCSPLSRNQSAATMSSEESSPASTPSPPPASRLSRRSSNAGIMFSNSSGMLKPPPIQRQLECSLEDLCYGVHKKIKITRDVVKHTGIVVQEEEILTIKVKPGWKKGTKITFVGLGNEKPGVLSPADIIFVISEKRHNVFKREGDNLEIAVEIPLVQALTGCHISIPLLGGDKMTLDLVDDVIFPGYQRVVRGLGMPVAKQQGKRGDLKVTFLVDFPKELTDQQRLDVIANLQDSR